MQLPESQVQPVKYGFTGPCDIVHSAPGNKECNEEMDWSCSTSNISDNLDQSVGKVSTSTNNQRIKYEAQNAKQQTLYEAITILRSDIAAHNKQNTH